MSKSPSKTMRLWNRSQAKQKEKQMELFDASGPPVARPSFYSEPDDQPNTLQHINDMFSNTSVQLTPENVRVHITMRVDTTHEEDQPHFLAMLETWIDDYNGMSCNYPLLSALFAMASTGSMKETPRRWTYCRDMLLQVRTESTLRTLGPINHTWIRHTGMGVHRINIELTINVTGTKRVGRLISQEILSSGLTAKTMPFLNRLGVYMTKEGDIERRP